MNRSALLFFPLWLLLLSSAGAAEEKPYALKEGDILFTSSAYGQGQAIMDATRSRHTHCGVVLKQDGRLMVIEAVEPVKITALETFISHSDPGTFLAKRLKQPPAPEAFAQARIWALAQVGKHYDGRFLWGDGELYCSELVWKMFQKAGAKLCEPRRFADYDLEKPSVKKVITERFGSVDGIPKEEQVVAPGDLAVSTLLIEVPRE